MNTTLTPSEKSELEDMRARIAAYEAKEKLNIKFGTKGNIVVGGKALGQRFPVTLYAQGWLAIIENIDDIKKFIDENKDKLAWK